MGQIQKPYHLKPVALQKFSALSYEEVRISKN